MYCAVSSQECRVWFEVLLLWERDLRVLIFTNEVIIIRMRQIASYNQPAIVAEPKPSYIESPVVHSA